MCIYITHHLQQDSSLYSFPEVGLVRCELFCRIVELRYNIIVIVYEFLYSFIYMYTYIQQPEGEVQLSSVTFIILKSEYDSLTYSCSLHKPTSIYYMLCMHPLSGTIGVLLYTAMYRIHIKPVSVQPHASYLRLSLNVKIIPTYIYKNFYVFQ